MTPDLTLFAGIAALTAIWSQIRGFFDRCRSAVVTRVTLHGEIATLVASYLYEHGHVINWGDRYIRSNSTWVRPLDRVTEVAYEHAPMQPLICWLQGRPVMFHCPTEQNNHGGRSNLPDNSGVLVLTTLRGCLDIKTLTRTALESAHIRQSSGRRYFVRRISGKRERSGDVTQNSHSFGSPAVESEIKPGLRFLHWESKDIGSPQPTEPFASLALCPQGSAARADFQRWLSLKKWYQQRGIPWRRGHLYYGPPGTGKTSLARALAQQSDMPVFAYDLSTLDNEQFSDAWQNMQEHTPCMALIEDLDGTFQGRKNVLATEKRETLTFDCFLNALGGIQTCDGVFIIITTNKPDTLDDALGKPSKDGGTGTSRPGRIDAAYCLELPAASQRCEIITRICGEVTDGALGATSEMTAAQVTEYAILQALAHTWNTSS